MTAPINIKMATLRYAELGTRFTVFLMCVVLDIQRDYNLDVFNAYQKNVTVSGIY